MERQPQHLPVRAMVGGEIRRWADTLSAVAGEFEQGKNKILREMIRHEDTLRDNRLGYLLTLNGFLFAALAFSWKTRVGSVGLIVLLAVVGFVVGISGMAAQEISNQAVDKLRALAEGDAGESLIVGLTGAETAQWADSWAPWNALPKVFVFVWPAIAVLRVVLWIATGS
ncbi:MAG TPA: hypothetical protein VGN59_10455 [Acidimicrobiia bacterium]